MIGRVHAATGIDLRNLQDNYEAVSAELDDPGKLRRVLEVMTEDQRAKAQGIPTIDDVLASLTTEPQVRAATLAVYQAAFDFFPSLGATLNEAMLRTLRAIESAETQTQHRMRQYMASGQMDQLLAILTEPFELAKWIEAATQPKVNPEIAQAMKEAKKAETAPDKQIRLFVQLCLSRGLKLTEKSGASPEPSDSTQGPTPGNSSP